MVAAFDWSARSKCIEEKHLLVPRMHSLEAGSRKVSRPSHMSVLRKLRFVDGRGRRNSDRSLALACPYGSSTATSTNSAFAGIPMPTRIRPLDGSFLYAARRASTVETSASGEFEPSLV